MSDDVVSDDDIHGKCTGMLSLERLNILLHAYNQTKQINLHSITQPPVCKTQQLKL